MIHLVHGINSNGKNDIYNLAEPLRSYGHAVNTFTYPMVGPTTARNLVRTQDAGAALLKKAKSRDSIIAHSNGARVTWHAMSLAAGKHMFDTVILFAPAMEAELRFPYAAKNIFVIHNPRDLAILAGEVLPYHPFGAMGRIGYQGDADSRVVNIQALPLESPGIFRHAGYFTGRDLNAWADLCNQRIGK